MTGLETALREAAERVMPSVAAPPEELWAQGRRRVRRRRLAGLGAVAGAVLAVIVAVPIVEEAPALVPAARPHEPALPKNIHKPSRWIPGTDDEGPLGQLAVLGSLSVSEDGTGYYGISATTGEYRMLDLPGRVDSTAVSLSPDGRRVAYWFGGKPRRAFFPAEPGITKKEDLKVVHPVGGYAVYDTATGRVTRHRVTSDYGIRPSEDSAEDSGLLWVDDASLVVEYGFAVFSGNGPIQRFLWNPGHEAPRPLPRTDDLMEVIRLPGGTLLGSRYDNDAAVYVPLDQTLKPTAATLRLPHGNYTDFSRQGRRVVATGYVGDGGVQRVLTGVAGPDNRVRKLTPVGDIAIAELLGWRGQNRVLVAARPTVPAPDFEFGVDIAVEDERTGEPKPFGLYEVDLASGKTTRLGTAEDVGQEIQVATDLVDQPMVRGGEPPFAVDPRLLWGGVGGLTIVALLVWRRRSRARP